MSWLGQVNLQETVEREVRAAVHRATYRDSPLDRAIGRHEAAHTLTAFLAALPLAEVLVRDDASGEMNHKPPIRPDGMPDEPQDVVLARLRKDHPDELRAALGKRILVQLSGYAADLYGDSGLDRSCSKWDETQAAMLAESAAGIEGRDELLDDCRATAERIVRDGWSVIEEFSALLVDQRRLPGTFVEAWMESRPRAAQLRDEYRERYAIRPPRVTTYIPAPPDDPDWWSDA